MITGKNESKILTKHASCKCKCKFNSKKCNEIGMAAKANVSVKIWKNIMCMKNIVYLKSQYM